MRRLLLRQDVMSRSNDTIMSMSGELKAPCCCAESK